MCVAVCSLNNSYILFDYIYTVCLWSGRIPQFKYFQHLTTYPILIAKICKKLKPQKSHPIQPIGNYFFFFGLPSTIKIPAYFCNPLIKWTWKSLSNVGNIFFGIPPLHTDAFFLYQKETRIWKNKDIWKIQVNTVKCYFLEL